MALLCSEDAVHQWLRTLSGSSTLLFAQIDSDGAHRFVEFDGSSEPSFSGYRPSQLPPGKAFTPAKDVLLTFEHVKDGGFVAQPVLDESPRILAGVRPCDLRAISLMDAVNREGHPDPSYLARRENSRIIGWACAAPCDERCFCASVGSLDCSDGADVMLAPTNGGILAEARSPAGEELLSDLDGAPCEDVEAAWDAHRLARPEPFGRQLPGSIEQVHQALKASWDSPVWAQHSETCLSCGTCNLVCPTCYCFDTFDEVEIAKPSCGQRCRSWDSCMLPEFAIVAGGHDFREGTAARHRHRIKRKFEYLPDRFGGSFCVGCGRCGAQCTVGIDIFDMAADLLAEVSP